ncbi:hypothetical protein SCACP_29540 [Sporomusa carbonis]|uniref:hypothetical protein n=1 Tax=Sporomusa carbonis TaxID=3076075 RepID=UPI003A5D4E37
MTKIVSDLLTLARADASVTTIVKEKFDINVVAEKVIRSFQPVATEKGIKLEFAGTDNLFIQLIWYSGDEDKCVTQEDKL